MVARIGELLVENGYIVEQYVNEALEIQKQKGCEQKLGEVLVELGYIDKAQLHNTLSEQAAIRTWYRYGRWPFVP
jgi:type IV pilus assembly protein PilB